MKLLRKRNCPECRAEMRSQLINLHYKKEASDLHVEVIGIPANVCTQRFYRIIPGKVTEYIDSLVDPFYESEKRQHENAPLHIKNLAFEESTLRPLIVLLLLRFPLTTIIGRY